ncbi:MAG TPA: hypothetical protein VEW68_03930 [Patescibacteria group bacterium]|nr:hypothetical protein [Patescibacteria group bacterium]
MVYLAALAPAVMMALAQPVWSRIDEAQHTDFIVQLAQGVYPAADATIVSSDVLGVMRSTGFYTGAPLGTYPTPDLAHLGPPPSGMSPEANAVWMARHLWQLSFEAAQTPAYYVLMVPVWWVSDPAFGPMGAIYVLRLINAVLVASIAPMAVFVARMLAPARPQVAAGAAVFAVVLPGLDLNLTRISNDTLAAVLGSAIVLLAVRWRAAWTWKRGLALGLLLGLGLMTKITVVGLAPAVALSGLWPSGPATRVQRLAMVAAAGTLAVVCLGPWLGINAHIYGALLPGARAARLSDAVPSGLSAAFVPFDVGVFLLTYWSGEPFGLLPGSLAFAILGALFALMSVAGLIRLVRLRPFPFDGGRAAVAATAVGGMVALTLLLPAAGGFEFAGPGRYAYEALPATAALLALGAETVLRRRMVRATLAVYGLAASAIIVAGAAAPPVANPGPGRPPAAVQQTPVDVQAGTGDVTFTADRIALDPGARAIWIELAVSNAGATPVEWSATPAAQVGGTQARAVYEKSTRVPGWIGPGAEVSGWFFIPIDPAALRGASQLRLHIDDVATNNYSSMTDLTLDVPVAGLA